jgi:acetyl-CoA carboxylase biotin carboxyl carrier protein
VADDKRDAPRPFDVKTVEYLLRLMSDHELSEIDLKEGDQRIRLRKGADAPVMVAAPAPVAHAPAPTPTAPAAGSPASPPPAPAGKKLFEIKSELIGTFYARPAPDKPEYVKVGTRVTPDTTVCIVMAMKVNNEIKAGVSGTVTEVVAKNEDFVDFNSVLFRVDPG